MNVRLVPCPSCERHLRVDESSCPFCATAVSFPHAPPDAVRWSDTRLSRSARVALGAAMVTALDGCASAPKRGGPPPPPTAGEPVEITEPEPTDPNQPDPEAPPDAGAVAPLYGEPGPPPDEGTMRPKYGAPPPPDDPGNVRPLYGVPPKPQSL
ncbi:MAG: hypothetical protein R3B13_25755 [Polyangiaceae bacterium]